MSSLRYLRRDRVGSESRALFLDRDGVLNERIVDGYVTGPDLYRHLDKAHDSIRQAAKAGALIVVVTNQGGIAKEMMSESDMWRVHALMIAKLATYGVELDAIYVCPHHPNAPAPSMRACECRKPRPGLITRASEELGIAVTSSAMIGDQPSDAAAALAAGIPEANVLLIDERDPIPDSFVHAWLSNGGR